MGVGAGVVAWVGYRVLRGEVQVFACAPLICFYDTCWCLLFLFAAPAVAVSHWGEQGQ